MNDLIFAFRQLRQNLGFTAVAVLTLALGIGVTTSIFSIINSVLLRPLPYPDSSRLVYLRESERSSPSLSERGVSGPNFKDWRAGSRGFASLGMYTWADFWLVEGEDLSQVRGLCVSADLFPSFGVEPFLGRGFQPEDERGGGVALLGYELWRNRFGGDTNVVGRSVVINEQRHIVVGVMPPGFGNAFDSLPELWVPLLENTDVMRHRDNHMGWAIGLLKPGVTLRQAQSEMDVLARQLAGQSPAEGKDWGIRVTSLRRRMTEGVRPALLAVLGGAGFLLLIVCANLGNLMLSRATVRQREFAVRAALGACAATLPDNCLSRACCSPP